MKRKTVAITTVFTAVALFALNSIKANAAPLEPADTVQTVLSVLNVWLPIAIAAAVLGYVYVAALSKNREKAEGRMKAVTGIAVISGISAVFVDLATIAKPHYAQEITHIIFLILANYLFAFSTVTAVRKKSISVSRTGTVMMAVAMLATLLIAAFRFNTASPHAIGGFYDSFTEGVSSYRLDLQSFIGGFALKDCVHGSALLLAPLEFIFPGRMIGLFVSNVVITEVTLVILYLLLRSVFKTAKPAFCALFSALLVFFPFQLRMFTYLSWDYYLVYYGIWLLYAFRKKNNVLIGFCGFLMSFTKFSGLVFYSVFLLTAAAYELAVLREGKFAKRLKDTWQWSKVLLWILPVLLYAGAVVYAILVPQGILNAEMIPHIGAMEPATLLNTLMQMFVFAFRWILVLSVLVALIKMAVKKRLWSSLVNREGGAVLIGSLFGSLGVAAVLLLFDHEGEYFHYTAPLTVFYALWVPLAVQVIFKNQKVRTVVASLLAVLFLAQVYMTLDPSIVFNKTAADTGEKALCESTSEESVPFDTNETLNSEQVLK